MFEREFPRVAKYLLRHWKYFERNINNLQANNGKLKAVAFFKALKRLEEDDIRLLAHRYYESTEEINFSKSMGDYQTVKPVDIKVIAERYGVTQKSIEEELKAIEYKLGSYYFELKAEAEREQAVEHVDQIRRLTLAPFTDEYEIKLLKQAFAKIADYRKEKEIDEHENAYDLGRELRRMKSLGV